MNIFKKNKLTINYIVIKSLYFPLLIKVLHHLTFNPFGWLMDFKNLIDLVQTVTRNKIKNIEVLGNPDQKGSLVEMFYDSVAKGIITSDEAAVMHLYGHSNIKDAAYQRLKSRLLRQLNSTIFFIDVNQPAYNERSKAYFACYRDFAAALVFMLRGSLSSALVLMEQILEHCIKYEFIELTTEITRQLRTQTGRNPSTSKSHQYYVALHRLYEEKRRLEMLALDYHEELVDYYMIRRSPNQRVKQMAENYFNELMPMASKADTSRFYFYTYQIAIIKNFATNDCRTVIQLADEALKLLESRKNTNRSMLHCVALQKLSCLTQLRIFDKDLGKELVNNCFTFASEGDINWFRTIENYFYYLIYKKDYAEALYTLGKAMSHPYFYKLEGLSHDNLLLLGGYLHLLAALNKLDPQAVENIAGPYRYGKLVNEIKVMDKDREGMNIPLLLLPILYNLAQGNGQSALRSKESLEKYRQRYLDNEMNQRSAVFVNMLLALDKKAFNPSDAEKRIQKGLAILKQGQPQVGGQSFAIEIIPYEDLWEMLIEKIGTKKFSSPVIK